MRGEKRFGEWVRVWGQILLPDIGKKAGPDPTDYPDSTVDLVKI
jgi:hypothetical protein